jgi:signal transduction histidine kinase/CheY-like chemotaxis protein
MSERILIVEDNLALAANVVELLAEEGLHAFHAEGASSAEQHAEQHGFDLAIVDIRLSGGVSGLDLVPRLRRHSTHGEIVLMTGDATLDSAIQAIRRGVYAYITKPFEPTQLVTLVKRALAQVALKREKHALTQRLEASEALYRGVVESVEACILGLNSQGVVCFVNRFAEGRLGDEHLSLIGRELCSLCDQQSANDMASAVERATSGLADRDVECRLTTTSGIRTIRWTLTPLEAVAEPIGATATKPSATTPVVLAAGIDITDRLHLEKRSAEAEAMAAMGVLTTGLAHEIRNPLNAAKLQLELLTRRARRTTSADANTQLVTPALLVKTEIDRLSSLLDEFLELARPRPLELRDCSAAELFEKILQFEQPAAQKAGALLTVTVVPPDLRMRADSDKLKQVLINLINNAVDAVAERDHGLVELRGEAMADGRISISVSDNGSGVSKQLRDDAFRPFVTSKAAGTGLGLSIVRKIVAQHGGTAELIPRPEGGTVARFYLPG